VPIYQDGLTGPMERSFRSARRPATFKEFYRAAKKASSRPLPTPSRFPERCAASAVCRRATQDAGDGIETCARFRDTLTTLNSSGGGSRVAIPIVSFVGEDAAKVNTGVSRHRPVREACER